MTTERKEIKKDILKPFTLELLEKSSGVALEYHGKITEVASHPEDSHNLFTIADTKISEVLRRMVMEKFPDHNIYDEESRTVDNGSKYTWVFDPIDGTFNFIKGLPHYGIIVGLLDNWEPIMGAVSLPWFGEIYYAQVGKGATCNGQVISAVTGDSLKDSMISWGIDPHPDDPQRLEKEMQIYENILQNSRSMRLSNSAYDACMVFKGKYGAYLHRDTKIWEAPAFQVLAEESGAVFTSFEGKQHDYQYVQKGAKDRRFSFCIATLSIHQELQQIIKSHL